MLIGSRDNISDEEAGGQYPVVLSPELVQEYDLYMENQEFDVDTQMDMEAFIQHPNNNLNIVIISILLFLGLTNNIVAFPVMLFR